MLPLRLGQQLKLRAGNIMSASMQFGVYPGDYLYITVKIPITVQALLLLRIVRICTTSSQPLPAA
jgi:hypothetical protein